MSRERIWVHSKDVAFVDGGDRVVVLPLSDLTPDGPQVLMGPAAVIWRAADGASEPSIVAAVAAEFDARESDVSNEIRDFLSQLSAHLLIRIVED